MNKEKTPSKKHFTDISRPVKTVKAAGIEIAQIPKTEMPKRKNPLRLILAIILAILLVYLLIYALSFINLGGVLKNAFQSLLSYKTPGKTENVFKKIVDEFKSQMEGSGLAPLLKSIPEGFGDITAIGKTFLEIVEDTEYLSDYGLPLSLNQKGDLVIEKLENLKNNVIKIEEAVDGLRNQPIPPFYTTGSVTTTASPLPPLIENFDFDQTKNFLAALIDWLRAEPEQHLLMLFSAGGQVSSEKFYSDITIQNASITNIITKNTEDETIKFGGIITINMPVVQEISQIVGLEFENQDFKILFLELLEKIANADKGLKSIIYGKIGDAFKNKEILISFPDAAIQSFFDELQSI